MARERTTPPSSENAVIKLIRLSFDQLHWNSKIMTTRAQRFFTSAAILSAIWLLLLLDVLPFPIIDHTAKQEILSAVSICYPKSSNDILAYIAACFLFDFVQNRSLGGFLSRLDHIFSFKSVGDCGLSMMFQKHTMI